MGNKHFYCAVIITLIVHSPFILILPTVPIFTLEVPSTVDECDVAFNATVILVRPEGALAHLEINIMDTEITAQNPG